MLISRRGKSRRRTEHLTLKHNDILLGSGTRGKDAKTLYFQGFLRSALDHPTDILLGKTDIPLGKTDILLGRTDILLGKRNLETLENKGI